MPLRCLLDALDGEKKNKRRSRASNPLFSPIRLSQSRHSQVSLFLNGRKNVT